MLTIEQRIKQLEDAFDEVQKKNKDLEERIKVLESKNTVLGETNPPEINENLFKDNTKPQVLGNPESNIVPGFNGNKDFQNEFNRVFS